MKRNFLLVFLLGTLLSASQANAVSNNCSTIDVSQNFNLTEDNSCSNADGSGNTLFNFTTSNVSFNCNGFSLVGSDAIQRSAFAIENVANISILNCNVRNYSTVFAIYNSSNVLLHSINAINGVVKINSSNQSTLQNFSLTGIDASGISITGNSNTNFVKQGTILNYAQSMLIESSNTTVEEVNLYNSPLGITSYGNFTILKNTYSLSSSTPLQLYSNNNTIENFTVRNSSFSTQPSVVISGKNSVVAIEINNSTHDAILLNGSGNVLSMTATGVNGSALSLSSGAVNNSITINSLSSNLLDLNISDASGNVHGNTFTINTLLTSVLLNVINSLQRQIATFNVAFSGNNTSVRYTNLTLFNSTGIVNASNLTHLFSLSSSSASVNASVIPFLSQEATITFNGVSYANNSVYEVLRDNVSCNEPNCTKISSSPVSFRVLGFSNYSTHLIQVNSTNSTSNNSTANSTSNTTGSNVTNSSTNNTNASANTTNPTTPANSTQEIQENQPQQQNTPTPSAQNTNETNTTVNLSVTNDQFINQTRIIQSDINQSTSPLGGLISSIDLENQLPLAAGTAVLIAILAVYQFLYKPHLKVNNAAEKGKQKKKEKKRKKP